MTKNEYIKTNIVLLKIILRKLPFLRLNKKFTQKDMMETITTVSSKRSKIQNNETVP